MEVAGPIAAAAAVVVGEEGPIVGSAGGDTGCQSTIAGQVVAVAVWGDIGCPYTGPDSVADIAVRTVLVLGGGGSPGGLAGLDSPDLGSLAAVAAVVGGGLQAGW